MKRPDRVEQLRVASALLLVACQWPDRWPLLRPIVESELQFSPGLAHEARWAKTPEEVRLVAYLIEQAFKDELSGVR